MHKAKKLSSQKRLQKNGYGNRNQFCVEASLQHSKNDVSPTRNHCFHKCHQAFENHEIGPKGWTFGHPFVMKMQMLGGLGGVKVAARWRHSGGTVAAQWRHGGVKVAPPKYHQNITKISPEMAPKPGN